MENDFTSISDPKSLSYKWNIASSHESYFVEKQYQAYLWGGGQGTLVDVSQIFWKLVDVFFSQKRVFFRNFRDVSANNTPKITFCCIIINKFPKNFQKSAQKFFAAATAPRKPPFSNFLLPTPWRWDPPYSPEQYMIRLAVRISNLKFSTWTTFLFGLKPFMELKAISNFRSTPLQKWSHNSKEITIPVDSCSYENVTETFRHKQQKTQKL